MPASATAEARPISGVCPVLATSFDDDGVPDAPGLARIAGFAIRCGADALVYPGVASEVEGLSDSERNDLLDVLATAAHGRVPRATNPCQRLPRRVTVCGGIIETPARAMNVARSRTGYRGRPGFDGDCEAARGMPRCRTL